MADNRVKVSLPDRDRANLLDTARFCKMGSVAKCAWIAIVLGCVVLRAIEEAMHGEGYDRGFLFWSVWDDIKKDVAASVKKAVVKAARSSR